MDNTEAENLAEAILSYSMEFDRLAQERHLVGAKEYGVISFLGNDVMRMMMEELADTANYCRMQFIKLMMLQQMLEEDPNIIQEPLNFGADKGSFKGTGDAGWQKDKS